MQLPADIHIITEGVHKVKNAIQHATEAVTEHEHSKFSHQFLPTWSENYVCVGGGSSLSWGSLELFWAWQLKYNAHYKNVPSLHPAQGLVGSWMLQSTLFIKQYLDWGIGALGLAYQLNAGPILLYQCVLQCLAFVLKVKVNEIYIICEMKPKLSFMKTTRLWKAFIFLGCLQCFTLCSTDLGFGGKLQQRSFCRVLPRFSPPLSLLSIRIYTFTSKQ